MRILLLGFSIGLAGCAGAPSGPPMPAPTPVTVSHPVERDVTNYAVFTARTAAVDSVEVRAHVWGYLDKVNFKEGALVKKGDVLFELDPRPYQALLNQAKSKVAQDEAQLSYDDAEYQRYLTLVRTGAVSRSDLDKIAAARGVDLANIGADKAVVASRQLDLDYTQVIAPVSGRVSRYVVTVGNLIQSGDQSGGTLLTTIVSVDPMYAYFDVDEHTVLRIRQLIRQGKATSPGDGEWPVCMGLANEAGFPHQGTINFVDNQVKPKTGTLRLRGVFPNKDEALSPGFFARVRVPIGFSYHALLVSDRALDTDQGQKVVYVVDKDNKVVSRVVRLGALHDGLREINDGLKPGERVIVNGLQQVRPGLTVEPKLVDMPGGSQRSEVRGQRSEVRARVTQERSWVLNHKAEHSSDLGAATCEVFVLLRRKIAAVFGEVERSISLAVFAVAVRQLGHKMSTIAPLGPGLTQVHANRSRRAADLSSQRIAFLRWKTATHSEDAHGEFVGLAIDLQLLRRANDHYESPVPPVPYRLRIAIQDFDL
jgi:RND family efflux transporter MFP subunit